MRGLLKMGAILLLTPVCDFVGGRGTSGSGIGYNGNVLLKTNVGEGEAEVDGLMYIVHD